MMHGYDAPYRVFPFDEAARTAHVELRVMRMLAGLHVAAIGAALLVVTSCAGSASAQTTTTDDSRSDHDEITGGGPWHFKSVPCVDGTVSMVGPRLVSSPNQHVFTAEQYRETGVVVMVRLAKPTAFISGVTRTTAGVTHYQGEFDDLFMSQERPGTRVQVCLIAFPTPRYDPQRHAYMCNPDADPRGWIFRVYDYARHGAYYGSESEHLCGGA